MDKFCSAPETTRYTYDKNGNITGIYSKVGNADETTVATYEYDELNQLVKENNKNYTYDFGGDILSAGNNTYSYSTGEWKDQLTSFNGEEVTYDESGNPLNYLGATLTWKNGRQLASYTKGTTNVTYKYNENGLRTQKTVNKNGTITTYKYTWSDDKLTHQSWDNKYMHFYYDYKDEIIGFTYYNGTTSSDYTYIKNMQGDVISIVDDEGTRIADYSYDVWGRLRSGVVGIGLYNPIRYRGYCYDDEISMYYLQSRYYDPAIGKFINSDDTEYIGYTGTILSYNIFSYCENDCVNCFDSSATKKEKIKKRTYKVGIFYSNYIDDVIGENHDYTEYAKQLNKDLKKAINIKNTNVLMSINRNAQNFVNKWNKLSENYDIVFILSHGTRTSSDFIDPVWMEGRLKKKNIKNLVLLTCDAAKQPYHWDLNMRSCLAYFMSELISGYSIGADGTVGVYQYKKTKELLFRAEKYNEVLRYSSKAKKRIIGRGWIGFKYDKKIGLSRYYVTNKFDFTAKTLIDFLQKQKWL